MEIHADLHAHSGYAGGVGEISLAKVDEMMSLKGVHLIGTGDCLHPRWLVYLKKNLKEDTDGIFGYEERETKFVLQTEIILTSKISTGRKSVHTVLLFPSFDAVDRVCEILGEWGVKNTIGRPFVVCEDKNDVSQRLYSLKDIDPDIEVIPAHILTPDGIYGSNRPIIYLSEFFGEFSSALSAVETGLSADPGLLQLIPELQGKTWISNSDAHSHHLNRMGREFTTFDVKEMAFPHIIEAIRKNRVLKTAEFHPAEGRYFLTGHRGNRKGHNGSYCYYAPKYIPEGHKCPICSKELTIGVLERALTLSKEQSSFSSEENEGEKIHDGYKENEGKGERKFVNMIPLAEVVAKGLNVQTATSKKVLREYERIVSLVGSECALWFMDEVAVREVLKGIDERVYSALLHVKRGEFEFYPPGFDGEYGELLLGKSVDVSNVWEMSANTRPGTRILSHED